MTDLQAEDWADPVIGYDDIPGPLTRSGHPKAAKAALARAMQYVKGYPPSYHEVFDALLAQGYTITTIEGG